MPNHLHVLIGFCHTENRSIYAIVGIGKSFMAYELIKRLKEQKQNNLLRELPSYVNNTERKQGKLHDVFEPSFDRKEGTSDDFIEQKLNCIQENSCRGRCNLV